MLIALFNDIITKISTFSHQEIDACVTPVLELDEAKKWQHHVERGAFAKSQQGQLDPVRTSAVYSKGRGRHTSHCL